MGMYTRLEIMVPIHPDHVEEIKRLWPYIHDAEEVKDLPNHPFFKRERASGFLHRSNGLRKPASFLNRIYEECYYLQVDTCLKNYSREIQHFLDWLCPLCIHDGTEESPVVVGSYQYEEDYEPSTVLLSPSKFTIAYKASE